MHQLICIIQYFYCGQNEHSSRQWLGFREIDSHGLGEGQTFQEEEKIKITCHNKEDVNVHLIIYCSSGVLNQ